MHGRNAFADAVARGGTDGPLPEWDELSPFFHEILLP